MFQVHVTDGIKKKNQHRFPLDFFFLARFSIPIFQFMLCNCLGLLYSFFLILFFFLFSNRFFIYVNMDVVVLKESVLMAVLLYDLGMERLLISPLVVVVVVMDGCGKVCEPKKKKKSSPSTYHHHHHQS